MFQSDGGGVGAVQHDLPPGNTVVAWPLVRLRDYRPLDGDISRSHLGHVIAIKLRPLQDAVASAVGGARTEVNKD